MKATLYIAQDQAIEQGIQVNYMLGTFRDQLRAEAMESAKEKINQLLRLERDEDMHYVHRAHTVHNIDHVQTPIFVRSNRQHALQGVKSLRRVYNELSALA